MNRLYLQIYLSVLGVLVLFALLMSVAFWYFQRDSQRSDWLREMTVLSEAIVPPRDAPPENLRRFTRAFAGPLDIDLTIYDDAGMVLAREGRSVPPPPTGGGSQWLRDRDAHGVLALKLADGRWLVARRREHGNPLLPLFSAILILTLATGIAVYPLVRRLTRRLEALKKRVEEFDAERLDVRAPIEGSDEIARLAEAFNDMGERIERLVEDKARLLANTSHELRTPLTRIRMAIALLGDGSRPELIEQVDRDIGELDDLIGELLMASRLEASEQPRLWERVDLLALATEEAARITGIDVRESDGKGGSIEGDPRLLRRLVRNLLENAVRHGEAPVEVRISRMDSPSRIRLVVTDHGPGIPESERERIFEPFYRVRGESNSEGGLGLGLALVRQIAWRHGGRVSCEPNDGRGSRFVLEFPEATAA